ncbi:MAG TPA: ABC transporter substrate-binding protein [Usitatibacter sp.]|nr:ABC transporter substrate-binding protein [Usitatibacter sp.]HYC55802.1 ABC transporter substrate-binding protein [Candidatus Binatia bacterium]
MKGFRPISIAAALATALSLVLAIPSAAQQPRKVKVGTFKLVHMMAPVFYEKFLPKDIQVELVYFASSLDIEKAVVNGNIDFGEYGTTAALIAGAQGDPQLIIGDAARKGAAIVVKKTSSIKTVADLRGKKIANFPGALQDVLLRATLQKAGLDPNRDVELIKVNWAEMPIALQRGDVDAYSGSEPHPTLAVSEGYGRILSYPYDTPIGSLNSALATRKELAEKEPKLVQAIVCAQKAAYEYMQKNPDVWVETGRRLFGFDPKVTKASMVNVGIGWELSDEYVASFKAMGKALLDLKIIDREPDYAAMIDQRFYKVAKAGGCK